MSERSLLISGGTVVSSSAVSQQDVLIQNETISKVGDLAGVAADEHVDATGLLVLPGAIDPHIHFNEKNKGRPTSLAANPIICHRFLSVSGVLSICL